MDERSRLKDMTRPKEKQKNNCRTPSLGSVETDIVEKGNEFCFGHATVLQG